MTASEPKTVQDKVVILWLTQEAFSSVGLAGRGGLCFLSLTFRGVRCGRRELPDVTEPGSPVVAATDHQILVDARILDRVHLQVVDTLVNSKGS